MEDTLVFLVLEAPCPGCGHTLARTTVLCRDPACAAEILVERPGLWCVECGCAALDAAAADPAELTAPAGRARRAA